MSNLENKEIRKMLFTDNDKTNYICGFSPEPKIIAETTEIIDINKVDYMIDAEREEAKEDYVTNEMKDKQKTLSYLSVKSVEEGIEWYRKEFPKLPEELLPLMSRWNWGDLNEQTKKSVKNKRKKNNKKEKPTFKIERKPVVITFN
jgi:GTPase involved in cell partitioning and DNA repair